MWGCCWGSIPELHAHRYSKTCSVTSDFGNKTRENVDLKPTPITQNQPLLKPTSMPGGLALDSGEDGATLQSRSRAIHFQAGADSRACRGCRRCGACRHRRSPRVRLTAPALIGRDLARSGQSPACNRFNTALSILPCVVPSERSSSVAASAGEMVRPSLNRSITRGST
jgi:hypothetical protein